jgi:hypothetical protein
VNVVQAISEHRSNFSGETMATADKRAKLRDDLIDAAESAVIANGLSGLKSSRTSTR